MGTGDNVVFINFPLPFNVHARVHHFFEILKRLPWIKFEAQREVGLLILGPLDR